MDEKFQIKRALFSCWEKSGIDEIASLLSNAGVEIISSGGTAEFLVKKNIPVTKVEEVTGFPEILDGRVKTLHPAIHGGILARRTAAHLSQLQERGIKPIDLVVVNLYPFLKALEQVDKTPDEMIEYIDIGGPAMIRAAAKNFQDVMVLHRPEQYREFMQRFREEAGGISLQYRRRLAAEAFYYTSYYDSKIAEYLSSSSEELPDRISQFYQIKQTLRYGENPHQKAALYSPFDAPVNREEEIVQISGKEMSFNNYVDVSAAYALVTEFDDATIAIIKHTNPCGACSAKDLEEAFSRALAGDPLSAFGGIIASNKAVDERVAAQIKQSFYECIIAPDYSEAAVNILRSKKNLRILKKEKFKSRGLDFKHTDLGVLAQEKDIVDYKPEILREAGSRKPTAAEWEDLFFAWKIVKHVKSNAIVFVKNKQLIGVGAGQMSRVDAVKLAGTKARQAGHQLKGAVMASDAFFPFRDGIDEAAAVGITAVIQPGGSIRDQEVTEAVTEHGMALILTGIRHFKH